MVAYFRFLFKFYNIFFHFYGKQLFSADTMYNIFDCPKNTPSKVAKKYSKASLYAIIVSWKNVAYIEIA